MAVAVARYLSGHKPRPGGPWPSSFRSGLRVDVRTPIVPMLTPCQPYDATVCLTDHRSTPAHGHCQGDIQGVVRTFLELPLMSADIIMWE